MMHRSKAVFVRQRRPGWVAALGVVLTLLVLATTGTRPASGANYTIQARNYEFAVPGGGSQLTVALGSAVTWVASGDPHTVTSGMPGSVDNRFVDHPASAGLLTTGQSFTTTFGNVGTFPYFCEIHPEQMSGVVTVISTSTKPPTPVPTRPPTPRPSLAPTPTAPPTPPPSAAPLPSASPTGTATASPAPASVVPSPDLSSTVPSINPSEGASPVPAEVGSAGGGAASSVATGVFVLGGLLGLIAVGWLLARRRRG